MNWTGIAAVLLAAGVGLGAFGAHGLRAKLDAYSMGLWEKAVLYQLVHAVGLLVASSMPRVPAAVNWLLAAGILIFSGSLYLLALTGTRALGAITPIGGLCFIAAWLWWALVSFRS